MAQSTIGALRVMLGLDAGEFERGAKRASKQADRFGKSLKRALGFTAAGLSLQQLTSRTRQAVKSLDSIAKTADKIGVTTKSLQELRFAASQTGVEARTMEMALQRFVRRTAEAAQGTGEAKAVLEQMGIQLRNNDGRLRSADELLSEVADKLSQVQDQGERVRIAFKLFDSEGVAFLNTLQNGSRGLADMRKEARDAGIVIEEKLIRSAERMNDRLDKSQRIIDAQLSRAFLNLAEPLADATSLMASFAEATGNAFTAAKKLWALTSPAAGELRRLNSEIETLATQIRNSEIAQRNAVESGKLLTGQFEEEEKRIRLLRAELKGLISTRERLLKSMEGQFGTGGETPAKPEVPGAPSGPGGTGGTDKLPSDLQARLDALRAQLDGEEAMIREAAQAKHELLREALEAEQLTRQEFNNRRLQIEGDVESQITDLRERESERRKQIAAAEAAFEKMQLMRRIGDVEHFTSLAISAMGDLFGQSKAIRSAEAAVHTAAGIARVFAEHTFPLPAVPYAAAVAAAGAAQIAAINRATPGGGNKPSAPAGAGGAAAATATGASTSGTTVNVTLEGEPTRESTIRLIERINDAVGDGATINVRSAA